MTEVFADTFFWLAVLNPEDAHHRGAKSFPIQGQIVTSLAVQIEVMDALSGCSELRSKAADFWDWTTEEPSITIVPLDEPLLQKAIWLHRRRLDKQWSLTDCISFEIMRQRGIATALTADRHFRQAGFHIAFDN